MPETPAFLSRRPSDLLGAARRLPIAKCIARYLAGEVH